MPYVTHTFAVMVIVSDYTDDEDTLIAALLHDTLEDSDYTESELKEDFGGAVRDIVLTLTEPKRSKSEKLTWKEQKTAYVKQLKDASMSALIVAAADKIHNMRAVVEEYYEDHSRFVADFGSQLDDRMTIYQNISNILNRRLKNDIIHEFNHVFTEYKNFLTEVQNSREIS